MNFSCENCVAFPPKCISICSSLSDENEELSVRTSQDKYNEEIMFDSNSTCHLSNAIEPASVSKKIDFFFESGGNPASISWPDAQLPDEVIPLSLLSELGSLFIYHLNAVGILKSRAEDSTFVPLIDHCFPKVYHSSMTFQVSYRHQIFKISLDIDFGFESSDADSIGETEEFADYLKDLIVLRKQPFYLGKKFENLEIIAIRCFLNDLELDI